MLRGTREDSNCHGTLEFMAPCTPRSVPILVLTSVCITCKCLLRGAQEDSDRGIQSPSRIRGRVNTTEASKRLDIEFVTRCAPSGIPIEDLTSLSIARKCLPRDTRECIILLEGHIVLFGK